MLANLSGGKLGLIIIEICTAARCMSFRPSLMPSERFFLLTRYRSDAMLELLQNNMYRDGTVSGT